VQVSTTVDGATYVMGATYDTSSRLSTVAYPSGFTARYSYNNLGYSNELSDAGSNLVHWTPTRWMPKGI
jgi:YD repeat-containing protein